MEHDESPERGHLPRRTGRDLAQYAGHRIAIMLRHGEQCRVVTGVASFGTERMLGNVLRIQLDDSSAGTATIILDEADWDGDIVPEQSHGCDYSLVLDWN